jgi:arylsulfatase
MLFISRVISMPSLRLLLQGLLVVLTAGVGLGAFAAPEMPPKPMNILLIVADDMGISDLGSFGGEIATPRLDALAAQGVRFSQFHVNSACSPTRSMLLSGVDSHLAGYGSMAGLETDRQRGRPGYELHLNDSVTTFAEILKSRGYRTSISGKWDQGGRNGRGPLPEDVGFGRSFVLLEGLADHFRLEAGHHLLAPPSYRKNGNPVDLPKGFYSSKTFADHAIQFIGEALDESRPFFSFLSFTAPHYPLQAPEESVARYAGKYDAGYQPVRQARIERMKSLGLVPPDTEAAPLHPLFPLWADLDPQFRELESRRMEVYSAMVEDLDRQAGRVLDFLAERGEMDNTLIMFLSDNGPEAGNPLDYGAGPYLEKHYDLTSAGIGAPDGFTWYGPGWAAVSAGPYRLFKHFMANGGVLSPAIIYAPGVTQPGSVSTAFASVLDIYPTFIEAAGIAGDWRDDIARSGRHVPSGASLMPVLSDHTAEIHARDYVFGLELFDRRMIRQGDWKLVWANAPWGAGVGEWSLFNLAEDPTELRDLASTYPDIRDQLLALWQEWVNANGVVLEPGFDLPIANDASHYDWWPRDLRAAPR